MDSDSDAKQELAEAVERILRSSSRRKLIVAGPGTGKTTIFKQLLEQAPGDRRSRLVLTFIRNLTLDLEKALGGLARVSTLHGYCQALLHQHSQLRGGLTDKFACTPGMASLIGEDWKILRSTAKPEFVKAMRNLGESPDIDFYMQRADYYNAVDFDDSVYRVTIALRATPTLAEELDLVLIDEFQDFNAMEAEFIERLASRNPIVIAGDDDQALYKQLRDASWDFIRDMHSAGKYEVFNLPFCMRCPEVVVGAVNDVVLEARKLLKLEGRIDKPYKYFAPKKGLDSQRYPSITLVESSVQTTKANYLGRFIAGAIATILPAEIKEAADAGEPTALVIGPKHYLDSVADALVGAGIRLERGGDPQKRIELIVGLQILSEAPTSNIGWRIVLEHEPEDARASCVRAATEKGTALLDVVPLAIRTTIEAAVIAWKAEQAKKAKEPPTEEKPLLRVKLTSFEGSKGMSAQHVFILGLQDGDLPRKPGKVDDIEVCRFLVGLTRTKKRCVLLWTRRFAGAIRQRSSFLNWIKAARFTRIFVDASYWKARAKTAEDG